MALHNWVSINLLLTPSVYGRLNYQTKYYIYIEFFNVVIQSYTKLDGAFLALNNELKSYNYLAL